MFLIHLRRDFIRKIIEEKQSISISRSNKNDDSYLGGEEERDATLRDWHLTSSRSFLTLNEVLLQLWWVQLREMIFSFFFLIYYIYTHELQYSYIYFRFHIIDARRKRHHAPHCVRFTHARQCATLRTYCADFGVGVYVSECVGNYTNAAAASRV